MTLLSARELPSSDALHLEIIRDSLNSPQQPTTSINLTKTRPFCLFLTAGTAHQLSQGIAISLPSTEIREAPAPFLSTRSPIHQPSRHIYFTLPPNAAERDLCTSRRSFIDSTTSSIICELIIIALGEFRSADPAALYLTIACSGITNFVHSIIDLGLSSLGHSVTDLPSCLQLHPVSW